MKTKAHSENDEMRSSYNFDYSQAARGKYYRQTLAGAGIVMLEPDVAKVFRSSAAVNEALRGLLRMAAEAQRLTARTAKRSTRKRKNRVATRR
jgi:hypothetical protein